MSAGLLAGRRVLVVEDETVIALVIEDALRALGCAIVGPVAKLEAAMQLARQEAIDAAILDVNIRGGRVFPVAEILETRNVPFLLASGYGDWALPPAFRDRPRLTKPFTPREIAAAIAAICPPA